MSAKAQYLYSNFAGFMRFFSKAAAKVLLFCDICKFLSKNMQIGLLFQLKGERTDEVSFAEEIDGIEAFLCFFNGTIACSAIGIPSVFNLLYEGVG